MSIGDLVTLAIFLCITPQVREAAAALARGEKKGQSNAVIFLYFDYSLSFMLVYSKNSYISYIISFLN